MEHDDSFEAFVARRHQAGASFVKGDPGPLIAITARDGATFFDPNGDRVVGAEQVVARYTVNADAFVGGTYDFQTLLSRSDGDIGYVVGLQRTTARLRGSDAEIRLHLRVTEIYQRSEGGWMIVHRHADRLPAGVEGD